MPFPKRVIHLHRPCIVEWASSPALSSGLNSGSELDKPSRYCTVISWYTSANFRIAAARSGGVAGSAFSLVIRYRLPTSSTCRVLVATARTAVGSLPPFRAPAASPALRTCSYVAHNLVLASATCCCEYVGEDGDLTGVGRNQPTMAMPRVTNRADAKNATTAHPGARRAGPNGGQGGGGPEAVGGGNDTASSYRLSTVSVVNLCLTHPRVGPTKSTKQ